MANIEPVLFIDPQRAAEARCPYCGNEVYPPTYFCIYCEGREDIARIEQSLCRCRLAHP